MGSELLRFNSKTSLFLDTVNLLYDAVCDNDKLDDFLESAAELFDSKGAMVGRHNLITHQFSFSRLCGYDWSTELYEKYDALIAEDPRLAYFMSNPFKAVHCRMGISEQALHASKIYQEVLSPGNIEYSLGVSLHTDESSLSYFLSLRSRDQPEFSETDCQILEELIPHLRRALQLQKEMTKLDLEKQSSIKAMDSIAVGLLILDKDLNITFRNKVAESIITETEGFSLQDQKLEIRSPNGHSLQKLVRKMITEPGIGAPLKGQPLQLERSSDKEPLQLFVSPFRVGQLRSGWTDIRRPTAFVVLQDPQMPRESRQELLIREYGLTPSQSNLTNLICEGVSLQDAASIAGITEASARQYLKLIFQKMGVCRQGEMVSKVLNMRPIPTSD